MGKNWSLSDNTRKKQNERKVEVSLYNHPDVGCGFSKGEKCIDCKFSECWEITGMKKFREDNKEALIERL